MKNIFQKKIRKSNIIDIPFKRIKFLFLLIFIPLSGIILFSSSGLLEEVTFTGVNSAGQSYLQKEQAVNSEFNETRIPAQGRLEFALVKGVDPAYIVLAASEHSGVHTAARDLQRDITKITGVTPNIVHSLKETAGRCVVIGTADCPDGKALLASVGVTVDDIAGKWELFKYQIFTE